MQKKLSNQVCILCYKLCNIFHCPHSLRYGNLKVVYYRKQQKHTYIKGIKMISITSPYINEEKVILCLYIAQVGSNYSQSGILWLRTFACTLLKINQLMHKYAWHYCTQKALVRLHKISVQKRKKETWSWSQTTSKFISNLKMLDIISKVRLHKISWSVRGSDKSHY